MADFEYQQLSFEQQLAIINNRILDLENQHLLVKTRLSAPDRATQPTQEDAAYIEQLEDSLKTLYARVDSISARKA